MAAVLEALEEGGGCGGGGVSKERREEAVASLLLAASPHPAQLAGRLAEAGYSLPTLGDTL